MSFRRRPIPSVLAAAVTAAVLLTGCSSSTGGTATSAGSTPAASSSATTSPVTSSAAGADPAGSAAESPSSSGGPSGAGSADAAPGGSGVGSPSSAGGNKTPADPATCASVAQVYGGIINATLPILQGKTGPEPFDADALGKALKMNTMGTLPAELAPDFAAYQSAAEQLRGKDLTAAAALLNGPELTKAANDIDQYTSDRC